MTDIDERAVSRTIQKNGFHRRRIASMRMARREPELMENVRNLIRLAYANSILFGRSEKRVEKKKDRADTGTGKALGPCRVYVYLAHTCRFV